MDKPKVEPDETYAIDGSTGRRVKVMPPGKCGYTCKQCWPEGKP